jgi:hypothetical protein
MISRCMILKTSLDVLWFKSKFQGGAAELTWISQINKAIESSTKSKEVN